MLTVQDIAAYEQASLAVAEMKARSLKDMYDQYRKVGFNEGQAMDLCKTYLAAWTKEVTQPAIRDSHTPKDDTDG